MSTSALEGRTAGAVTVHDAETLTVGGTHVGTIVLEGGATLHVIGRLEGSVEVASLATASISGDVLGRVDIRVAGSLVIEVGGRLAGPVTNYGSFINRGQRNGPVEGREPEDQSGAITVEPVHPGGAYDYTLPERA